MDYLARKDAGDDEGQGNDEPMLLAAAHTMDLSP